MDLMRAVVIEATGGPKVLRAARIPSNPATRSLAC
jgi:hypothetical protein